MVGPIRALLISTYESFDTTINNALAFLTGNQSGTAGNAAGILSLGSVDIDAMKDTVLGVTQSVLSPICSVILAICMLIELAETAMKVDMLKWEHGLKVAVKLVIAKVCIDVAPEFMWAIYVQCASWIQDFASMLNGGTSTLGSTMAANIDSFESVGLFAAIVLTGVCIISIVGIKICGLLVAVIAFARVFEILVYVAVSPIPCAFFPLGDGPGMGVSRITTNFFKNYIAVCLQGLLMAVCLCTFNGVAANIVNDLVSEAVVQEVEEEEESHLQSRFWDWIAQAGINLAESDTYTNTTMIQDTEDTFNTLNESVDTASEVIADTFNMSFSMLMLVVVLIVVLMRCSSWSKSIMDAH